MPAAKFQNVDIVFGSPARQKQALAMLDTGAGRDDILKACGAVIGVAGASLSIEKSEICVLMGLSGSGKSTLLRAVNGLNQVTRGSVFIYDDTGNSIDVARCNRATLRQLRMQQVAMVFQQFALLPWRTVAENVGFGLELRGMAKNEIAQRVADKLDLVQLSQWADKKISQLSGGMQQRVGLARAFATDADLLLMDEPFSALDPLIRNHLQDELIELQQRLRKTIIFVSHDLDEALKIGSHIAIMEAGRIVQYGRPEEIILNPANDYVARFVAHMNPLNVLRAASLMTPVDKAIKDNSGLQLEFDNRHRLMNARAGRKRLDIIHASDLSDDFTAGPGQIVIAPVSANMRDVIKYRHATGNPVLLADGDRITGLIGDHEIYAGILR